MSSRNRRAAATSPAKVNKPAPAPAPAAAPATVPAVEINIDTLANIIAETEKDGSTYVERGLANELARQGFVEINTAMIKGNTIATRALDAAKQYVNNAQWSSAAPAAEAQQQGAAPVPTAATKPPPTKAPPAPAATNTASKTAASSYAIDDNIPIPDTGRTRGGFEARYPFNRLEIGQSFHVVADNAEDDVVRRMSSSVSAVNRRHAQPVLDENGEHMTRKVQGYQTRKDEKGVKIVNPATGKPFRDRVWFTREMFTYDKRFIVRPAGADDPRGVGARIFRVQPDAIEDDDDEAGDAEQQAA